MTSLIPAWTVAELGKFYSDNRRPLVSYATKFVANAGLAEEFVQEAIIKVLMAAPELDSQGHANAYIRKTLENLCVDHLRREGKRPPLILIDDTASEIERSLRDDRDLADLVSAADDAAIVRQALSLLSPAERAALIMWEFEGRSARDIADELGVKESTVRHTVSRARASLRKILTNYIVDEAKGLTALDLLSNSYRRATKLAKDGSRIALSFVLLLGAFLGFTNMHGSQSNSASSSILERTTLSEAGVSTRVVPKFSESPSKEQRRSAIHFKNSGSASNAKSTTLRFPGLDKDGLPSGFTVTDATGNLGSLYFGGRDAVVSDAGISVTSIAKTVSGAANVFITQNVTQDTNGTFFDGLVSFGRQGNWVPLSTKTLSTDLERQASGNYLLTAVIQVKSEVGSSFTIPATAGGRDLEIAPARVIVRMMLDGSKTRVLAEAIQVIEKTSG